MEVLAPAYVAEQGAGSLIRNTYRIYFKEFWKLAALQIFLLSPFVFVQMVGTTTGSEPMMVAGVLLQWVAWVPAFTATCVGVSQVCMGGRMSLRKALRRGIALANWRVMATFVLLGLAVSIGMVALIVPGIILGAWFMLAPLVAILVGTWGVAALRRSRQLGAGCYWRNIGIFGLAMLSLLPPYYLALLVATVASLLLAGPEANVIHAGVMSVIMVIGAPLSTIAILLVYYDMRVRKEAFDDIRLLEDLRQ